jgi:hypothetical protein
MDNETKDDRFYMRVEIEFSVPYLDRNTSLTDQEIVDRVYEYIQDEREALVVEAKTAIIRLLDGEAIDG